MPTPPIPPSQNSGRPLVKSGGMFLLGLVCVVYLINPTLGFFELIPDVIPGVGNVDEALATVLLLRVLAYFGVNIAGLVPVARKQDGGPVIDIDEPRDPRRR